MATGGITITINVATDSGWTEQLCGLRAITHFGAPEPITHTGAVQPQGCRHHHRRAGSIVDLKDDMQLPLLAPQFLDAEGNAAEAPAGATVTYTSDNAAAVVIVDNGDGSLVARSAGLGATTAGPANIHADISWTDDQGGHSLTADDVINVVSDTATRATITFGTAEAIPAAPAAPADATAGGTAATDSAPAADATADPAPADASATPVAEDAPAPDASA